MVLPKSGVIKFSQLQTEFGGSNPISLSEYYNGGTLIPSGLSYTNYSAGLSGFAVPNVPTSGAISLGSDFHGSGAATTYTFSTTPYTSGYSSSNSRTISLSYFNSGYFANTGDTFLVTTELHPNTSWKYANTMNLTLAITAGTASSASVGLYHGKQWRLTTSYDGNNTVTIGGSYVGSSTTAPNGGAWLQGFARTN